MQTITIRPAGSGKPWRSGRLPALLLAGLLCGGSQANADPLPMPSADFALKANLRRGGTLDLAHSQGRMRVEMSKPQVPGTIVGIIDLKGRKMVMMMPNLPNMAVEIEIPPEYAVGAMSGTGSRIGQAQVAGETCDLWQVDPPKGSVLGATVACITADGIALRTEVELKGTKQAFYEAVSLTRGPQDPKLFQLPAGVQVMKVPKGKLGGALKLPGADAVPQAGGAAPAKSP